MKYQRMYKPRCKQRKYCCVHWCINSTNSGNALSYHKLPRNDKLRRKWLKAIGGNRNNVADARVCSAHFAKDDYNSSKNISRRRLVPGAIPSRNLPNINPEDVFSESSEEFNDDVNLMMSDDESSEEFNDFEEEELNVLCTSGLKRRKSLTTPTSMDLQEEATSDNTNIKVLKNPNKMVRETIIIKVTSDEEEDDSDNAENVLTEEPEEQTTINQLSNPKPSAVTISCKNKSCNFKCKDVNLILAHSKTCRHNSGQKHETKIKKIEPWYKCCICKSVLKHITSLDTHTTFHAKERGDLSLKVRFKKYFKGEFQGYNIHTYRHNNTKNNSTRDCPIELDYNPDETVFGCGECNFKTNKSGDLEKHEKLHWNAQKNEMFKRNKWFVCNICYFYSFDKQRYREHYQTHEADIRNKIISGS